MDTRKKKRERRQTSKFNYIKERRRRTTKSNIPFKLIFSVGNNLKFVLGWVFDYETQTKVRNNLTKIKITKFEYFINKRITNGANYSALSTLHRYKNVTKTTCLVEITSFLKIMWYILLRLT